MNGVAVRRSAFFQTHKSMIKRKYIFILSLLSLFFCYDMAVLAGQVVIPGEQLSYKIRYGFIVGGYVNFITLEEYLNGDLMYNTKVEAKTTGFIDQLYKLHDIYESYYDKNSGLPELAIRNISEGKYRFYDEVSYNHDDKSAYSQNKDTVVRLEKETFDVVSAIYFLRNMDWKQLEYDDVIEITVLFEDKPFPMFVVYKGREQISFGSSKYDCHKFAPVIDPGKIFQKKENMIIWFSDDENKIPVSIRFNLLIGAFRLELNTYENLANPFEAKESKR